jgi:hypothetical protein
VVDVGAVVDVEYVHGAGVFVEPVGSGRLEADVNAIVCPADEA